MVSGWLVSGYNQQPDTWCVLWLWPDTWCLLWPEEESAAAAAD